VIAIDTSSLSAFLEGEEGDDVLLVERALREHYGCFPPVVLTEILSDPEVASSVRALFTQIPILAVLDGYWERAGALRAKLLASAHKAKLADSLIAQSCLDHGVPLISRDRDFRHFATLAGLKLLA
jgi:predicted nucleic acid-binding protein